MTREEAIARIKDHKIIHKMYEPRAIHISEALDMAIEALELLDKLDEIITEQIDVSYNQVECQTLRWVLDKMSELEKGMEKSDKI